jgi:hypothetical protein
MGLLLAATLAVARPALADVEMDRWVDIDAVGESAGPAAEALARAVGERLKAEGARVVFLGMSRCEPGLGDATEWCAGLQAGLESALVRQGFRFLPEASKDEVRQKIAAEQVYQQGSMQVDVGKAVELGKQKAIQAFTSVAAVGDGHGNIRISATSINIRDGVVTVSENVAVKIRQEQERAWGVWAKSTLLVGVGLTGVAVGLVQADKAKTKGDDYYTEYKKAGSADDATAARKKVEREDKLATVYQAEAVVGAALAAYGLYYFVANRAEALSFKINVADRGSRAVTPSTWTFRPVVSDQGVGLGLRASW